MKAAAENAGRKVAISASKAARTASLKRCGRLHDDIDCQHAPAAHRPVCCFSSSAIAALTRISVCRRTPALPFSTRSTVAVLKTRLEGNVLDEKEMCHADCR
jgi:hypothetical protein